MGEIWKKGVGVFSFFDVYKIDNRVLNCDGMSKRVGFDQSGKKAKSVKIEGYGATFWGLCVRPSNSK